VASAINLGVIAFLALIAIWLFWRRGEVRDRAFLVAASLVYVAAMFATFWKVGTEREGELMGSLFLETIGFLLVRFSKSMKEDSK
jgi:hypothetical protein